MRFHILFCWLLTAFVTATAWSAEKPNILFLYADDMRADAIAAHGNPHIDTPNLDALAANGVSFHRNYCMGSMHGAVCVPSRAMILSGQAYFRLPMDLQGVETLPQHLGENGYDTFITGKWHNRAPGLLKSFQHGRAIMMGGMSNHLEVPLVDIANGKLANDRIGDGFSSVLFADAVIDFIDGHHGDAPFYCYVAFTAPHDPRQPPEAYRQMYYERNLPLPDNYMPQHPFNNGHLNTRDERLGPWPRTEAVVRDQLAEYYGLITHLDEQIGRILAALEASGQRQNTYIVFAADHGLAVGSHGLLGKQNIYEHSMRAPMIVAGPGIPKNESVNALTYLFDVVPTIAEFAGVSPLPNLDGAGLRPLWTGDADQLRDSIFLAFADTQRATLDQRWKLIRYPKINHTQLFDLKNDPHELHNLAGNSKHAGRVAALMDRLAQEQARYGDTAPLTVTDPYPKAIDMTGVAREPDPWQPEWIVKKYF